MSSRVLVVDDEKNFRQILAGELAERGHDVRTAGTASEALEAVGRESFDVVVLDVKLPDASGLTVLADLKARDADLEVILLTGQGSIEDAVQAMRRGAYDYVTKPCRVGELDVLIAKALERRDLRDENRRLREALSPGGRSPIVAESPAMKSALELVRRYADSQAAVLLLGESGTGKDVFAREVHARSPVAAGPFIPIHAASLAGPLVESELFGHERGAFTGADRRKKGLLELARGGTAFLDEIGELDPEIQVKLLRFLQSGEVRRVGGARPETIHVRVVAATNRDLEEAVASGSFRQDLFYRLSVLVVRIPPLRERREDVAPLARRFLDREGRRPGGPVLERSAFEALEAHPWPGNVRELENLVQRLVLIHPGGPVRGEDVARLLAASPARPLAASRRLEAVEREHVLAVLAAEGGDKRRAAEALGIALKTLYNKLHRYGVMEGGAE